MLMQASERSAVPPFLRPEQMFPPHNSAIGGASIPQTGGIPPTLPSAVFLQQMVRLVVCFSIFFSVC